MKLEKEWYIGIEVILYPSGEHRLFNTTGLGDKKTAIAKAAITTVNAFNGDATIERVAYIERVEA